MDMQIFRRITQTGVIMILVFCLTSFAFAETANEAKKEAKEAKGGSLSEIKEIEGEVSAVSKDYIAVVYNRDKEKGSDYEILLPIDKNIKLVHKQRLDQINIGDRVNVQYEELTEDSKERPKVIFKGNVITFIGSAEKIPEVPDSEYKPLSIKGIK